VVHGEGSGLRWLLSSGGPGWIDDGSSVSRNFFVGRSPGVTIWLVSNSKIHMGEYLGKDGNRVLSLEVCEIMNDSKCVSLVSRNSGLEHGLRCNDFVSNVR